jgi:hypothetical protein
MPLNSRRALLTEHKWMGNLDIYRKIQIGVESDHMLTYCDDKKL